MKPANHHAFALSPGGHPQGARRDSVRPHARAQPPRSVRAVQPRAMRGRAPRASYRHGAPRLPRPRTCRGRAVRRGAPPDGAADGAASRRGQWPAASEEAVDAQEEAVEEHRAGERRRQNAVLTVAPLGAPHENEILVMDSVRGSQDTKRVKEVLKALGGCWNPALVGWSFASSKRDAVVERLRQDPTNTVTVRGSSFDSSDEEAAAHAKPAARSKPAAKRTRPAAESSDEG
ncbi:hypothetical protein OAO87_03410 [bacterium]|nr:hypothetical protein [bacterium]